jgi:hypothetical protein
MKKIPKASYRSVEELERYISERRAEAMQMPNGAARQSVLKEVSKLRVYADFKRLLAPTQRVAP